MEDDGSKGSVKKLEEERTFLNEPNEACTYCWNLHYACIESVGDVVLPSSRGVVVRAVRFLS